MHAYGKLQQIKNEGRLGETVAGLSEQLPTQWGLYLVHLAPPPHPVGWFILRHSKRSQTIECVIKVGCGYWLLTDWIEKRLKRWWTLETNGNHLASFDGFIDKLTAPLYSAPGPSSSSIWWWFCWLLSFTLVNAQELSTCSNIHLVAVSVTGFYLGQECSSGLRRKRFMSSWNQKNFNK